MKVADVQKYKESLYTALSRDLSEFEKNFLLISAGILAFTITFISDIVSLEDAEYLPLLFSSWFFIALAIGMMMFTFLKSAYSCDKIWNHVDDFIIQKQKFSDEDLLEEVDSIAIKSSAKEIFKKCKSQLKTFRFLAIIAFLTGISTFALFVGINIIKKNKTSDTSFSVITIDKKTNSLNLDGIDINLKDSVIVIKK